MAGGGMGGGSSGGMGGGMNNAPSQPSMSNMQFNPYASGGMRSNPYGGFGGSMGGFQGGFGRPMGGPFGGGFQGGNQFGGGFGSPFGGGFQGGMGGPFGGGFGSPFGGGFQGGFGRQMPFGGGMGGPMNMAMPSQQPKQSHVDFPSSYDLPELNQRQLQGGTPAQPSQDLQNAFSAVQRDEALLRNQMSQLPPSAMNQPAAQGLLGAINENFGQQQPSQGFGQQGLGSFASLLRGYR